MKHRICIHATEGGFFLRPQDMETPIRLKLMADIESERILSEYTTQYKEQNYVK